MNKINRLFVELDEVKDDRLGTLELMMSFMDNHGRNTDKWKFDEIINNAGSNPYKMWELIKVSSCIYVDSALIYSYANMNSPAFFNTLMYKAINESVCGKEIYFFRDYSDIHWNNLEVKLLRKCFEYNKMFTLEDADDNNKYWMEVDIKQLIKELE